MFNFRRGSLTLARASKTVIEGLEGRQMLSASLSHHGVLNVRGTGHNDVITLSPNAQDAQSVDVSVNGQVSTFSEAEIHKVKVNAGAGDDIVTLDSSVTAPAAINGGAGNDDLTAGGGDDSLLGGSGNDTLTGGAGDDSLAGGAGDDHCISGSGPSTIDAGRGNDHVQFNPSAGVALNTLPAAIQAGLTTLAQGATITTVQTFHEDGHNYYGTEVTINGVNTRIVVDSSGNLVTQASDDHSGSSGDDGEGDHGGEFGTVVSVTPTTITVARTSEHHNTKQDTFTVTSATTITADGTAVDLSSLTAGTWVGIQTSSADTTTATSITIINHHIEGTVTAVDTTANTLTLTGEEGGSTTYTLTSGAIITVDGTSSTLSAVTLNSRATSRSPPLTPPAQSAFVLTPKTMEMAGETTTAVTEEITTVEAAAIIMTQAKSPAPFSA